MEIKLHPINENGNLSECPLILTEQKSYTLGRKSDNKFRIKNKSISKYHCVFNHNENGLSVEVLTSRKTLFINEKQIRKGEIEYLNNGDIVKIGNECKYLLIIKISEVKESESCINALNACTTYQDGDINIKSEPMSFENRMENNEEMSKISFSSTNVNSNQITNVIHAMEKNCEHFSNENNSQQLQFPLSNQISNLNDAMEISIDEHDDKSSLLPLRAVTNSSTLLASVVLPLPNLSSLQETTINSEQNENSLETMIKIENPDIPPTNLTFFTKDPSFDLTTSQMEEIKKENLNDPLSELQSNVELENSNNFSTNEINITQDPLSQLEGSEILEERIKIENPDIPSTNVNFFTNDPLSQLEVIEESIKIENPDIPSTNVNFFAKDPLSNSRTNQMNSQINVENFNNPSTNLNHFVENSSIQLESNEIQMEIKIENPDIPATNLNFFDENSSIQLKSNQMNSEINVENSTISPINLNHFVENSSIPLETNEIQMEIKVENPDIPATNLTLFDENPPFQLNLNKIPLDRIKQENSDNQSTNLLSTIELESNENLQVDKNLELEKQLFINTENCVPQLLEDEMEIEIEEHEIKPFIENNESEINNLTTSILRIRNDLIGFQQETENSNTEIRIKDEIIDSSFNIETDNNNHQTKDNNIEIRNKNHDEIRKKRRRDSNENISDFRIKQENIEIDENFTRPIKRERNDSTETIENYSSLLNFDNVKQEPIDHEIRNYSNSFEINEEKSVIFNENRNLNTSYDSDFSDCSTDDYDDTMLTNKNLNTSKSSQTAVKVPETNSVNNINSELHSMSGKLSNDLSNEKKSDGRKKDSREKEKERNRKERDKETESRRRRRSSSYSERGGRRKDYRNGEKSEREGRRKKEDEGKRRKESEGKGRKYDEEKVRKEDERRKKDEKKDSRRENYEKERQINKEHSKKSTESITNEFPINHQEATCSNFNNENSKSMEKDTLRIDSRFRNYTGGRVLVDDEFPESRERFTRTIDTGKRFPPPPPPPSAYRSNITKNKPSENISRERFPSDDIRTNKPIEKKKIGLAEYRNKKKDLDTRPPSSSSSNNEKSTNHGDETVPLTTFRQYGNRVQNFRTEPPLRTQESNANVVNPIFNELRTQPQGIRTQTTAPSDPRLARQFDKTSLIPGTIPPLIPGTIPPLIPGSVPPLIPGSVPPLIPGSVPPLIPGSVPPLIPGTISPMMQGSVPSMIPNQIPNAMIPGSVPSMIPNQIPTAGATAYPYIGAGGMMNYFFMPGGYFPGMYQFPYGTQQSLDPRINSSFPMAFPMNMPGVSSTETNPTAGTSNDNNLDTELSPNDKILGKNDEIQSGNNENRVKLSKEIVDIKEKNKRTATWIKETMKAKPDIIKNPIHKSRDDRSRKRDKGEMNRDKGENDKRKEHRNNEKINEPTIKIEKKLPTEFESEDLGDQVLMKIFSWGPQVFFKNNALDIPELYLRKQLLLNYEEYMEYKTMFFKLILYVLTSQMQESFNAMAADVGSFYKCRMLPDIGQKIKIKDSKFYLVPLYLKINVPITTDVIPPAVGDLLLITISNNSKKLEIFGYMEKIVIEEPDCSLWKYVTYLVSVKEQDFNIHNSTISEVKIIVNIRSFLEKVRAISHLESSPLLPFILQPKMQFTTQKPLASDFFNKTDLVYQDTLDNQQLKVVAKVMNSYLNNEPDVCLVQGSAGTGKSNAIVNIIFQLFAALRTEEEKANFRLLVCAASDADIDWLLTQVSKGIEELQLEKEVIRMVVIGPDEGKRERTKESSLSRFAKHHVESDVHKYQESMGHKSLQEQAIFIEEQVKNLRVRFEEKSCSSVYLQMRLLNKYYHIGKSGRMVKNMTPMEKKELIDDAEITFLAGANLIFSTIQNLSGTVMENFQRNYNIPVCIVDEAAQIQELDTLKVVAFKGNTLVLMGDKYKFPALDIPLRLKRCGWENSLFHRLLSNCDYLHPVINLKTQYRITPIIERWLINSQIFKLNTLKNTVEEKIKFPLNPISVFNLNHTEDLAMDEATFAATLMHCIAHYGDLRRLSRIISIAIIICDADVQELVEREIENKLENVLPGKRQLMKIEVGTIDKFQNYEADIVLASCVRNKNLVSYVGMQRLYSTVTRAKHCLIIFGRFARIGKYKGDCEWHDLIDNTKNIAHISVYEEKEQLRRYLLK